MRRRNARGEFFEKEVDAIERSEAVESPGS